MFTVAFFFFTILSYFTVVEPKTQYEETFSIDLMHRYSPKSPFYNSSMSSLERFQQLVTTSKLRHEQLQWLQNNKLDTTILTNQGDYLMTVYVGTPPVELVAVIDTSVDLTWFQCGPCLDCYRQTSQMFRPDSSHTYRILPCDSSHCSRLNTAHLTCNPRIDQCSYWYSFGNQTSTTRGIMGNDTFSFRSSDGENPSFPLTVFGCGFDQVGVFDPRSAGVVGLGNGPLSLVYQLSYEISYKFSYCLASRTSTSTSKLRFGGYDFGRPGAIRTPFIIKSPASFYNLELNSISIGQMRIQVENDIIIDTATTLTYLTPSLFSSVETMVNAVIGRKPMANSLIESVLCYATPSGVLSPPDIVFHFSGGNLVLEGGNVFFEYRGSLCMSIVPTPHENDPMILGNMAQVNLEVEFDLLSRTVSFAQKDCSQDY